MKPKIPVTKNQCITVEKIAVLVISRSIVFDNQKIISLDKGTLNLMQSSNMMSMYSNSCHHQSVGKAIKPDAAVLRFVTCTIR